MIWALTAIAVGVIFLGIIITWNTADLMSLKRQVSAIEDFRMTDTLPPRSLAVPEHPHRGTNHNDSVDNSGRVGRHSGPRPPVAPVVPE